MAHPGIRNSFVSSLPSFFVRHSCQMRCIFYILVVVVSFYPKQQNRRTVKYINIKYIIKYINTCVILLALLLRCIIIIRFRLVVHQSITSNLTFVRRRYMVTNREASLWGISTMWGSQIVPTVASHITTRLKCVDFVLDLYSFFLFLSPQFSQD